MPPKKKSNSLPQAETLAPAISASALQSQLEVTQSSLAIILSECDRQGLTINHLVTTIKAATLAEKHVYDKDGDFVCAEPDHTQRLKAAMLALELRGDIKGKTQDNRVTQYNTIIYKWKNSATPKAIDARSE